jgi:hypothetical protein
VLKKAFDTPGPVLVSIHVDYRDNHKLFEMVNEDSSEKGDTMKYNWFAGKVSNQSGRVASVN